MPFSASGIIGLTGQLSTAWHASPWMELCPLDQEESVDEVAEDGEDVK